jgi:hypothetical protein
VTRWHGYPALARPDAEKPTITEVRVVGEGHVPMLARPGNWPRGWPGAVT